VPAESVSGFNVSNILWQWIPGFWSSWCEHWQMAGISYSEKKHPYSTMVREMEKWSGIRIRDRIATKNWSFLEGHPLPMPTLFRRRPLRRSWVILVTAWTNDRMTERPTALLHQHWAVYLSTVI